MLMQLCSLWSEFEYFFFREFSGLPFSVKFKCEVDNYSNCFLHPAETYVKTGHIHCPPAAIPPGEKHSVSGHKTANTVTGCEGEVR